MTFQGIREPVLVCVFTTLCVVASPTRVSSQEIGQTEKQAVTEPPAAEPTATESIVIESAAINESNDAGTINLQAAPVVESIESDSESNVERSVESSGLLRFSFDGVAWSEVIQWLADEAELALHVGDLPTGSLTYSDPSEFTVEDAIDRINLFLLAEGFTLVRTDQMLSVINLSDPRGIQQLDA